MNVLITGASRGIGRACAERFARAGHDVTAVARTTSALRQLAAEFPERITAVTADLTTYPDPGGPYDLIVLNAGYYAPGSLLDPARDVFAESWTLNVMANHHLARILLPPLIERGHGHLIVIGSTATDDTSPHMTAYAATKKALRGLFEGWEQELSGTGVAATLIAPGSTLTSSWDGETPPPRILAASDVADLVYRAVTEGLSGRITIKA
ncbi:SDR family oxidoreductase [Lewinella sp. JB7]|uniref:SDR family NAD(P)-dependent oxidoreductase n=1 Tax=Lewinella sp. JB7 TaxID=2962887 RepID=UPI0020C991B2|nr:SDR family NAD(P)-dependent oxidoreductase [Lewinella sp. JB7]MCP9234521.1 SDR family NAD(P)-dependent oxidoreductase [Lewinella sp. JB7]